MEKLEFHIPKGYIIDKEKSTDTKLVFEANLVKQHLVDKTKVNFSIHNPNDWFFVKTDSNNWVVKGKETPYKASNGGVYYCIESKAIYSNTKILCSKKCILEYRKATEEEIKEMYEHYPYLNDNPKWKDFGVVSGYFVSSLSNIAKEPFSHPRHHNKNIFPSKKEAEACLALSQLLQWRDKYNGEGVENWCDWEDVSQTKYSFEYINSKLEKMSLYCLQRPLCFKTSILRDKFIENFKELIEVAKPLL